MVLASIILGYTAYSTSDKHAFVDSMKNLGSGFYWWKERIQLIQGKIDPNFSLHKEIENTNCVKLLIFLFANKGRAYPTGGLQQIVYKKL